MFDIIDTFPQLPEVFDKNDVVRILGYEPGRASLNRAWDRLLSARKVVIIGGGTSRRPTKFRKLTPE
jgi:thiamine pyrophosphate-dependent acetolactate synthase large subunit-like protein